MANKQQAMKAKKDARRKTKTKERVKAANATIGTNGHKSAGGHNEKRSAMSGFNDKTKNVYELVNDVRTQAKKVKGYKNTGGVIESGIDRTKFLKGVSESLDQMIKVHAGITVYLKLADEGRFVVTPEHTQLIEEYEREVVRMVENVDAIVLLDQAKKVPEDYVEIVLDTTDAIRNLMVILQQPVYDMLMPQQMEVDRYATEHLPTGMSVVEYMRTLHEDRIKVVGPSYQTTGGVSAKEIADMVLMTEEIMQANMAEEKAEGDISNLEPDFHPDITFKPVPPITEERNKETE